MIPSPRARCQPSVTCVAWMVRRPNRRNPKEKATDECFKLNGEDGFGAIGVLGTDYYDRLLILPALQQAMPDKVYFTLELDTRFLHPDEQKWARNLIVASTLGLTIHSKLQR